MNRTDLQTAINRLLKTAMYEKGKINKCRFIECANPLMIYRTYAYQTNIQLKAKNTHAQLLHIISFVNLFAKLGRISILNCAVIVYSCSRWCKQTSDVNGPFNRRFGDDKVQ